MAQDLLGSGARPLRVAVIGSGPSAFYAVEALFKVEGLTCRCDMFERLPTPFGLVRGGVAPDHQKIKGVARIYDQIAQDPRYRFFGNVEIGRDLSVDDLRAAYDCRIWAIGNEGDRRLGIPGEDLVGVHSATAFVGWYNGHPDHQRHRFDLDRVRRVAVIGNGNVAMDVARILLQEPSRLESTDISDEALAALRRSEVEEVVLIGRRGPAQAAFSPKELKEIADLDGVAVDVDAAEVELDPASAAWLEEAAPRSAQRNVALLHELASADPASGRKLRTVFRASPRSVLGEDGRVVGLELERNQLEADAAGVPRPHGTGQTERVDCDLVLAAIGYRGVPLPGLPFCERRGIVPNDAGRVLESPDGAVLPGDYVVGWAKRGPTGLIGNNSPDSKDTVAALVDDLGQRTAASLSDDDASAVPALLATRGVDFVDYADWQAYDGWEVAQGVHRGKVRHKLTDAGAILAVMRQLRGSA
ncbi:MAG: NADP oxidoreductase [Planctomycetota bacterium]|nr:NADP oxidoreductase [Planctomycetota bacterium]